MNTSSFSRHAALTTPAEDKLQWAAKALGAGSKTALIRIVVQDPGSKSRNIATAQQRGLNIENYLLSLQVPNAKIQISAEGQAPWVAPPRCRKAGASADEGCVAPYTEATVYVVPE